MARNNLVVCVIPSPIIGLDGFGGDHDGGVALGRVFRFIGHGSRDIAGCQASAERKANKQ